MKVLGFAKIALFVMVLLGASACGDKNYIDYRNTDEELCNKDWIQDVVLDEKTGDWYRCILNFQKNGKYDKTEAYYEGNKSKPTSSETFYDLDWRWADDSKERIVLSNKTITTYFDNVMVRDHYLTGVLDGEFVMFSDYK
ncbi:hypothetical protein [Bacteroides sp.]